MLVPVDTVFTHPVLEGITLVLQSALSADKAMTVTREAASDVTADMAANAADEWVERALAILAGALQVTVQHSCHAWTVQRVAQSPTITFDLTPLLPNVTPQEAWHLTYALRAQPGVCDAEPSFTLLQDTFVADRQDEKRALTAVDRASPSPISVVDQRWGIGPTAAPRLWLSPSTSADLPPDQTGGAGIRIGYATSAAHQHPFLHTLFAAQADRLRTDLARDFVEPGDDVDKSGLAETDNLITPDLGAIGTLTAVAPTAEVVPLRVAQRCASPAFSGLLESSMRRLRDAIYYAINGAGCQILVIGLGWLPHRSLHAAIQAAARQNVIICAAAGNYTGFVVWPAAYPEVIAVAGCTPAGDLWWGASRGPQVTVSAPATDVTVALIDSTDLAQKTTEYSAAYAVAAVAGLAARWLARHDRAALLAYYAGEFTLTQVFRYLLTTCADSFTTPAVNGGGAGISNARRLLAAPLPTLAMLRAAIPTQTTPHFTTTLLPGETELAQLSVALAPASPALVQANLAAMLATAPATVATRLPGVADELLFHILTTPLLRQQFVRLTEPTTRTDTPAATSSAVIPASPDHRRLRYGLRWRSLSDRLRNRLG